MTYISYCVANFHPNLCEFQVEDPRKVIGSANLHLRSLFAQWRLISKEKNPVKYMSESVNSIEYQVMLWHNSLGHQNFNYIEKLYPHLFINKKHICYKCENCQLAKHTK